MTPYNQILDLFNTKEDNYLEKIMECFKQLNSVQEMQDIIERFEKLNESCRSDKLKDFITELYGIKWQLQHFQKGLKKNDTAPYKKYTDYEKVKTDQEEVNKQTRLKYTITKTVEEKYKGMTRSDVQVTLEKLSKR
jgi:hypothetical protein